MLHQKVLRRGVLAAQPRREVVVERRARPVIVKQQPVIIRRGGIRKRAILGEPDVVVVRNTVHFLNYFQNCLRITTKYVSATTSSVSHAT